MGYKEYVERYAESAGITVEEAETHRAVQIVKAYYEEQEQEAEKDEP